MWPKTDLTELLGIEHPIIQAPMAGSTTLALAAAVCNAGGLGGLGCGTMPVAAMAADVGTLRAATNRPFNLNFFAHRPPTLDAGAVASVREQLRPLYEERAVGPVPEGGPPPFSPFGAEALEALLDIRPAVVSFHFGLPDDAAIAALKGAGCVLMSTATCVAEAVAVAAAGFDAIVAQGYEAGGHRGSIEPTTEQGGIGTMALVPQVADAVDIPVIATSGIGDARGIAAAFALGASGVQLGTAFLKCPEANVGDRHRELLRGAGDRDTVATRAVSGRASRGTGNRYTTAMASAESLPDYPLMYAFSDPLRQASVAAGDDDFEFFLYGRRRRSAANCRPATWSGRWQTRRGRSCADFDWAGR